MSISNKAETVSANNVTIAENEQKVYEAGAKSEYDRFWDSYQNNGNGMLWGTSGFKGYEWNNKIFYPKYDIIPPSGDPRSFFQFCGCSNLRERIDGRGLKVDLRNKPSLNMWFRQCATCELPDMDTSQCTNFTELVYQAANLHTIPRLNLTNATLLNNTFTGATALQNITFEGTIPISISFASCTLLTHESLMSIITALKDYSASTSTTVRTCTLGSENLAKLTEEEQQIAIDKGWTLA